jgi:4-amino-4-deoxy-L-arabinose transferase-like glycosyltransferase
MHSGPGIKRRLAHLDENGIQPMRWTMNRYHLWLLIAGLILRIAFSLTVDKESSFGGWDGKEYYAYAHSILSLRWDNYPRYFNSIRPPLYPLFLVPFVYARDGSIWPIQFVQSVISVGQAVLLAQLVGRWRGQRAGSWALALVLFNPFLIYYCAFVLTETVFITLVWLGIYCFLRTRDPCAPAAWLISAAVAFALACLTKAPFQLFLIFAFCWVGWTALNNAGLRNAVQRVALFTAIVSAVLLPAFIANYVSHSELSLAPGAGPEMYAYGNSPEYLRTQQAQTKSEYYEISDRLMGRLSVDSREALPAWINEVRNFRYTRQWWLLQWLKFRHFWTPWLNPVIFSRGMFLLSLVSITPVFVLGALELLRLMKRPDAFLGLMVGLMVVGYTVGGLLFHVQVRYRIPYVDMAFIVLTASLLGRVHLPKLFSAKRLAIVN